MERSEPTLVPEWLKGSGSASGGSTTSHQIVSSSLHSDDRAASRPSRNKSSVSVTGHDIGRSFVSDQTTSSYFRRSSSSNGSSHFRSQGSFGGSNRDRDWEKEIYDLRDKEKSILGDHRRREYSDTLENIVPSWFEKDLRRAQSMLTGKRGETWPRKVYDSSNANKSNHKNSNGLLSGGSAVKSSFEWDFPSLGAEERQAAPELRRVSSPGLSTAIQSLPIGTSAVIHGDGWTSALAEVPVLGGSNGSAGSVQQVTSPTSASLATSMMTGMNMAETLVQGPTRAHTAPQLSAETQKLEELHLKQSRQLIPVTPSMPKALVLNPSDKPKPKHGQQLQHQISSSHAANQSSRNGSVKSDISRTSSVGKLQVLKPAREINGSSPTAKDSSSPTSANRLPGTQVGVAPSVVGSAPLRGPSNNPLLATAERKPALAILEKKPSPQSQSRNDFFNLMRKKSMTNPSSVSLSVSDKSAETESVSAPNTPCKGETPLSDSSFGSGTSGKTNDLKIDGVDSNRPQESIDDVHQEPLSNGKGHRISNGILCSEEEEAAFLRSLGWEENDGEDEGLTEEEISDFYKHMKSKPSPTVLQGMQPKFLGPFSLRKGSAGAESSSGSSSPDTEFES